MGAQVSSRIIGFLPDRMFLFLRGFAEVVCSMSGWFCYNALTLTNRIAMFRVIEFSTRVVFNTRHFVFLISDPNSPVGIPPTAAISKGEQRQLKVCSVFVLTPQAGTLEPARPPLERNGQ